MDFTVIRSGIAEAWTQIAALTPRIVAALAIVLAGVLVATLLRRVARQVLTTVRFDRAVEAAGVRPATEATGYEPSGLVAGIVYWVALLVSFQLAAETLGAATLSAALGGLVAYLPNVLVAVAVLVIALALARFVAGAVEANIGEVGGRVARWSIIGFGAFAALSQLQIAEPIVNALFYAAVATVGATAVIAFGVGGIPVAREALGRLTRRSDAAERTRAA
jgi:hypothetical protein